LLVQNPDRLGLSDYGLFWFYLSDDCPCSQMVLCLWINAMRTKTQIVELSIWPIWPIWHDYSRGEAAQIPLTYSLHSKTYILFLFISLPFEFQIYMEFLHYWTISYNYEDQHRMFMYFHLKDFRSVLLSVSSLRCWSAIFLYNLGLHVLCLQKVWFFSDCLTISAWNLIF